MQLSLTTFLIVCPLVFLGGFVDSIAGGGGLITVPAYMLAGLPIHSVVATNKLSSACGTFVSTIKFFKERLINIKIAIPTVIMAIVGSTIGAHLSLMMSEDIMKYILVGILPVAAFFVFNKKIFHEREINDFDVNLKSLCIASLIALIIGGYDGFYGPGAGTFLIIAFNVFAKMSIGTSNAQSKVINLTTNLTSLVIFALNGQVLFVLGIVAALFNVLGNYLGSSLAIHKGTKVVRPVILVVLLLLCVKISGII